MSFTKRVSNLIFGKEEGTNFEKDVKVMFNLILSPKLFFQM